MRKITSKIAGTLLGLSLALGVGLFSSGHSAKSVSAGGTDNFNTYASSSFTESGGVYTAGSGVSSLSLEKNESSATAWRNSDSDHVRIYGNWKGTISAGGQTITQIVFTTVSGYADDLHGSAWTNVESATGGTGSSTTYTVIPTASATSVVFVTVTQTRIKSISVTYGAAAQTYTVTYSADEHGSGSYEHQNQPEGTYTLLPFSSLTGVSPSTGYKAKRYSVGGVDKRPGDTITLDGAITITVVFVEKGIETTYDFATNFATYAKDWTTTYGSKTLSGVSDLAGDYAATVVLGRANKQSTGTVPTLAVQKNSSLQNIVVFTLTEANYKISEVEVVFVQRSGNTPTVNLFKGNDSSTAGSAIDTAVIGTKNVLSVENLNGTSFSVSAVAAGTNNNCSFDISSIFVALEPLAEFGTLDHISITGMPNVVYHVGETFSFDGFAVTAYDGPSEGTANFIDVTNDVETDLDNPTPFVEGDVPGFDCEVSYTGHGGSDTTSFHVDVYALAEYELVTSELSDWSGNYLIVGTNSDSDLCGMNGALMNPDVESGYKVVTEKTSGAIEAGQELEWVVSSMTGGYSIRGKSGKYIGSPTGSSNGLLVGDDPILNTFSISGSDVAVTGTNTYSLTLNTLGDRFRYYNNGTVKLYKLKTSSKTDAFAQTFLGAFTCDNSGVNKPTFTIKEGTTYWSWTLLATEYDTLNAVEKEAFRLGVASKTGTTIEQALARYDLVVGKYFKGGLDTELISSDFMNRNPAPLAGSAEVSVVYSNNSASTIIIVVVALTSITSIGVLLVIKRKRSLVK